MSCNGMRCRTCLEPECPDGGMLMRCSNCKWANYCSKTCQRADWAEHHHHCAPVAINNPNINHAPVQPPAVALLPNSPLQQHLSPSILFPKVYKTQLDRLRNNVLVPPSPPKKASRRARSGPPPHSPIALSDVHKEAKSPNASKKVKRNIAPALIAEEDNEEEEEDEDEPQTIEAGNDTGSRSVFDKRSAY